MIFSYCPIEMLPYEACANVTSISSTLTEIPVGYNYFISSLQHSTTTYFNYTDSINGTVVGIDTNLTIVQPLDMTNKTFALSDSNIFGTTRKPYIRLLCDNVKVEAFFFATSGPQEENGFGHFQLNDDGMTITVSSDYVSNGYVTLARYAIVSWTKDTVNKLGFEDGHPYDRWVRIWGFNPSSDPVVIYNDFEQATGIDLNDYYYTIPALNTIGNYYKVGYHVNFIGESRWAPYSYFTTKGTYKAYDSNGFYNLTSTEEEIEQDATSYIPNTYKGPNSNIWGNNNAFYKTKTSGKYILASSGLQLETHWSY